MLPLSVQSMQNVVDAVYAIGFGLGGEKIAEIGISTPGIKNNATSFTPVLG